MNLARIIDAAASGAPDRVALVEGESGLSLTFGRLREVVDAFANELATYVAGSDSRVVIGDDVGIAAIVAMLSAVRAGAAAVLVNPHLGGDEISTLLESTGGAGVVVCGSAFAAKFSQAAAVSDSPSGQQTAPTMLQLHGRDVLEWGRSSSSRPGPTDINDERTAVVLFTSGTTGIPKPVPISHGALGARLRALSPGFDADRPLGVRLMCVPLFHIGGLLGLLLNLWSGNTTVLQCRFDAGEWLALVERYRVDSSFVVPTMLHRIIEHPDLGRRDLSSLSALAYGAAAAPVDLVRKAMDTLPWVGFMNTFGQTETLGGYTALAPGDHRNPERAGSVGKPLPGVEIKIVAPDSDQELVGQPGELLVRSSQNINNGWLRTGDLVRADDDGYLYVVGRLADLINRGGEKFAPAEIEAVLRLHPQVSDVGVAGLPDPEMGERVGAAVVVRKSKDVARKEDLVTVQDLSAHCAERLARFKVPERIVFVDQIPYNQMGKVTRKVLADLINGSA